MSNNKCTYIYKKGTKKGNVCNILNCKIHIQTKNEINNELQLKQEIKQEIKQDRNLKIEEQIKKKINDENTKQKIIDLNTNIENKTIIMKHYLNIKKLDNNSSEYYKNQMYIEQTLNIPWNKYYNIRNIINLDNEAQLLDDNKIKNFINNIKLEFDKEIYGMDNIKNEIINYICKFISNPSSQNNIIALYGSAGVCKTKFIKVLSKIINLPLKIISLGGMKDSNYLLGHHFTYQESQCGIIVQSIIDSHIMNPILYFDELDKVSQSEHGQDIYSVLSNITDPTINSSFKDHYFSQLNIDLSKVFYVFTFNDISKINKILLDRLNIIYIDNPSKKDKIIILKNYCLNDIIKNININLKINFTDDCFIKIIDYTDKFIDKKISSGIREYIRILEKIILEINKETLLTPNLSRSLISFDINSFNIYFNKLKNQFIILEIDTIPEHMYI